MNLICNAFSVIILRIITTSPKSQCVKVRNLFMDRYSSMRHCWWLYIFIFTVTLQGRHNGRDSVSNHQPHDCLLNRYSDADQRKHQRSASLAFVTLANYCLLYANMILGPNISCFQSNMEICPFIVELLSMLLKIAIYLLAICNGFCADFVYCTVYGIVCRYSVKIVVEYRNTTNILYWTEPKT